MNEDFVPFELAKKLEEKGFNKFCENGYFLKSGIEYSTPNNDSVLVSSIGERIFNTECCWFKEEIEYGRDIIYAPTISQVLKRLREEKGIHIEVSPVFRTCKFSSTIYYTKNGQFIKHFAKLSKNYDSYEEAVIDKMDFVIDRLI